MKLYIYFLIVLLTLYGDLIKRYFPSEALAIIYVFTLLIMTLIIISHNRINKIYNRDGRKIMIFAMLIIITYALQVCFSFNSPFIHGASHFLYMSVPLLFCIILIRFCPQFDLQKLANIFLIFMIPINLVGFMQYIVDPSFFISTAYSERGGIIERNFIDDTMGGFTRYPSIFVSADRYSAMALMQFILSTTLLPKSFKYNHRKYGWVFLNIMMSLLALGIAGARSRIFIATFEFAILGLVFVRASSKRKKINNRLGIAFLLVMFVLIITSIYNYGEQDIPIVMMLEQTLRTDDISNRLREAVLLSVPPDTITLFGSGLGTESLVPGKPGEFGIRSIWAESGLIWGSMIILFFIGLMVSLFKISFNALKSHSIISLVLSSSTFLLVLFGLLSGFTGVFELSTGILLACIIRGSLSTASDQSRATAPMAAV